MGCTSAKQVSAVPNDDEGRGKAYSNGDLFSGQLHHTPTRPLPLLLSHSSISHTHTHIQTQILTDLSADEFFWRLHFLSLIPLQLTLWLSHHPLAIMVPNPLASKQVSPSVIRMI